MTSHPFYLDCDTGIDDALALAYLLASPQADLRGIGTVSGNVSAATGARNTLDLLQLAGHAHIPVAVGAHDPLAGTFHGGAPHVHGANGIGEVSLATAAAQLAAETAAEMLVRLAHEHPGTLRVLAIGPLTNIAEALRLDPELPRLVEEITIMGGAALAPGNITAVAEANIANDPEAAAEVLAAGWNVTLVPLDVTMANVLEESHRQELLASSGPVPRALGEMLGYYFRFYEGISAGPAPPCTTPSPRRSRWTAYVRRSPRWCRSTSTPPTVPAAARPSATCADCIWTTRSSPVPAAAWCWRSTATSRRTWWRRC